jgi:hypothetical protein
MIAASVGLFVAMVIAQLGGRAFGRRRIAARGARAVTGVRAGEAAVYGLLSLLIAFTFAGANSRFDARRTLVVEQIEALSTAWMSFDLLASNDRDAVRALFRRYVDGLNEATSSFSDRQAFVRVLDTLVDVQNQLWQASVGSAKRAGDVVPTLVLPPLNRAFDLSGARLMAALTHVQPSLVGFLWVLAVLSAVVVGHSQAVIRTTDLAYVVIYSAVITLAFYVILDLDFPSFGLIRLGEDFMVQFRASLG